MGSGGGSDQHFCLRWNNFHSNIATSFEQLRDHEDFVDVTLACEGRTIKAHKVVLSACSPYFRNLLKQNPCQHPIIILRDVAFVDVSALLSFVYQGEVYVSQERLTAFLHTAELLHIKGLTEQQHHHTTASTTQTGPITGTNSSSCGGTNNSSSHLGSGIAVSLLAPHSGGTTVPLTHLIAAAPQPPHHHTEQSPHPAARGVPRSPSPTRPHSSPSPPLPPPPYIPPPSSHHISPPPKKRRHLQQQQQQSSLTSLCASSIASPLSSSSSSTTTEPHPLSPPHPSDNPPPPIPALATPKIEAGTSLLSGSGSSCLLGGSTLAAALTAPRGDTPLSAASVSAASAPPPLLLPVEVKQEAVESPSLMDDAGSSSSGGSNLASEQQAVNLVLESNTGSPSPSCSILRQRIQGYQGSPDAPPPPNYPPPSRGGGGGDDDGGGSDGGDGKEGLNPPSAVAIIRRQHMIGLAAAAAAAGVYNSGGGGGGTAPSLGGGDAGQPAQPPQEYHQHPTGGTTAESVVEYYSLQSAVGRSGSTGTSLVTGKLWHSRQPGICPICQRVFSNKFNLKQHIINIHTAGGGIECGECHKMCKNKWYLRRHQVTHHGAPLRRGRVDGGPCSPHTMPRHLHSVGPQ